ncbi:MAG: hypothetical protein L6Q97_07165 [Thermoanaerobaculia bacterium]|nr:hypothetical protein [Thermoanaerobaculia bacterium]
MKSFTLLFCAFLVSGAITTLYAATKSEQVERYLGSHRYKHDRPLGTVKFIFREAVLKRRGDGKKTYEQLLFNESKFSNRDNAGKLIGIEIVHKGKTTLIKPESRKIPEEAEAAPEPKARARTKTKQIAKGSVRPVEYEREESEPSARQKARMVAEINSKPKRVVENTEITPVRAAVSSLPNDPVRPRREEPSGGGGGISVPDSSTVVKTIDNAKDQITTWKGRIWKTVQPMWEFVMWVFSSLIVMLVCFAGLCRYVAKTAANESLINTYGRVIVGRWIVSAHQNAAAMLLIITWVIAIVLLIDVFMWLVFLSLPIWTLLIIWFPILWVAEKLTSWIVPNIPVVG